MGNPIQLACVACEYTDETFDLEVVGNSHGSFIYKAKCPVCGSGMVKYLSGLTIDELDQVISVTVENKVELSVSKRGY